MNALDFLVDFTALMSTSKASRPGNDGNDIDQDVGVARRKAASASEKCVTSSEGFSPINGKRSVNTIQLQSSMAPSLSQQTFPAHVVNYPTSNTQYYGPYEGSFAVPADPQMSQSFGQFLHQRPGLGLPYATNDDMSYLACDCERLAHWDPSYEMNYLLPAEPVWWIHVQPQSHSPNHNMRFLETQFVLPVEEMSTQPSQCMNAAHYCQYPPPHQAVSNDYAQYLQDISGNRIHLF
ncbi:uncharacterized protein ALTATR162_LOCUS5967 [Alternaria atra]|uniref:Uncharacterized protein n=1 Tax=Alternaria atra TaxID=119953 RepID=A0A8J2I296_9PLEO|nr:uncharacterized protein ALTATR162_LOCUS5967 [Alternaria atra]CAG5161124.1 unnamed protein product [Alternaria atra]